MKTTASDPSTLSKRGGLMLIAALMILLVWLGSPLILAAVVVIALVLFMHELGHFLTARLTGMKATEFFLGFGPRLWSTRRGETEYGIRALPLGAYVRITGMVSDEQVDPDDESRTYRSKSYPRRVLVITAGSLMHFLMAILALVVLHGIVGSPQVATDVNWEIAQVPQVLDTGIVGPAHAAGLQEGDRVLSLNDEPTDQWTDFVNAVSSRPGESVTLVVNRGGESFVTEATIHAGPGTSTQPATGIIGIGDRTAYNYETVLLPVAVGRSVSQFGNLTWQSLHGMWQIFSNIGEQVDRVFSLPNDPTVNENIESRPISLVGLVRIAANDDFTGTNRLFLFAALNIFIGVFNLLPLLPLDGGHLAIASYERWRERGNRKRYMVNVKKLTPLVYAVIAVLAFIGLGAIYLDIVNPVSL